MFFEKMQTRKNDGFTLVELIVVIAILAILASVTVPAYNGYVEKANIAADQQLVSEVANALTLYYYDNPGTTGGFVALNMSGASGDGVIGDAAMLAVFGDEWQTQAKLKYSGWKNTVPTVEEAQNVANSSYFKNNTPSELVNSFSDLTDALSGMAATASQDPLITLGNLPGDFMTDAEIAAMRTQLDDLGVSWDKDKAAYTTAVSNLLVQNAATEIGNFDGTKELSQMSMLATNYASLYGWGISTAEGSTVLKELNKTLTNPEISSGEVLAAVNAAMETAGKSESYIAYSESSGMSDGNALIAIMGTVSDWSADADMTTSGLYSSDSISNTVNNYAGAVSAISGMTAEQQALWSSWDGQGTIVYIDANGNACCPILSK